MRRTEIKSPSRRPRGQIPRRSLLTRNRRLHSSLEHLTRGEFEHAQYASLNRERIPVYERHRTWCAAFRGEHASCSGIRRLKFALYLAAFASLRRDPLLRHEFCQADPCGNDHVE